MSSVMEKYEKMAAEKAVREDRIKKIQAMMEMGFEKEAILKLYSKEEIAEAENQMPVLA